MSVVSASPVECLDGHNFEKHDSGFEVKIEAPINIALIKYWGKRNEDLILPLNDSISLSINQLTATTTISFGRHILQDSVMLNGKVVQEGGTGFTRFRRVFQEVRRLTMRKRSYAGCLKPIMTNDQLDSWHIKIVSETNFPVAAGLASSAAGFAAIAYGLGQIFQLPEREITRLARIGSGSACRSIKGGFVHWKAGQSEVDDSDCFCETIAPASHWPDLRALIIVINEAEKKVGSSQGMRNTIQTSSLLQTRVQELVPQRVKDLTEAIKSRILSSWRGLQWLSPTNFMLFAWTLTHLFIT
uniref:Diphosphomevalonate decarboxylase n=1 Tax=Ditylenchus dipsaci TaxID=166011 RepID=A0A915DKS5_9BILA